MSPPDIRVTRSLERVLILDRSHLHWKNKKLSLLDMDGAQCFSEKVHVEYYLSDVVIMKDEQGCKIIKGDHIAGGNKYISYEQFGDFMYTLVDG